MMSRSPRSHLDITNRRLVIGFVLILLIIGIGLIYWFYGPGAALLGILCLVGGFLPLIGISLIMRLLEWVSQQRP